MKLLIIFPVIIFLQLFISSCTVDETANSEISDTNNLTPIGAEVDIDEEEKLTKEETAEVKSYCERSQEFLLTRVGYKLTYNFTYKKCANADPTGPNVIKKTPVSLALAAGGQLVVFDPTGNTIPAFFQSFQTTTSGLLGKLCPGLLSGAAKTLRRYYEVSDGNIEGVFFAKGANCGAGVNALESCLVSQLLVPTGGQSYRIQAQTSTTWVAKSESTTYAGAQKVRNYTAIASCNGSNLYQVDTKIVY
jgi:hypothetical protein